MIVARHYGFTLVIHVSVCLVYVRPSVVLSSVFSFLYDNFSKSQWIFTKLGMCINIVSFFLFLYFVNFLYSCLPATRQWRGIIVSCFYFLFKIPLAYKPEVQKKYVQQNVNTSILLRHHWHCRQLQDAKQKQMAFWQSDADRSLRHPIIQWLIKGFLQWYGRVRQTFKLWILLLNRFQVCLINHMKRKNLERKIWIFGRRKSSS